MEKQFATYEISLAMKELGFDEECFGCFINDIVKPRNQYQFIIGSTYSYSRTNPDNELDYIMAPLWQQCIEWFYSEKNIIIEVHSSYEFTDRSVITYHIIINNKYGLRFISKQEFNYDSLYEAREQAILKCIELCKKS